MTSEPRERTTTQERAPQQEAARTSYERAYLRAENEADDGYDPSSDRPAAPEPLFERDPWS